MVLFTINGAWFFLMHKITSSTETGPITLTSLGAIAVFTQFSPTYTTQNNDLHGKQTVKHEMNSYLRHTAYYLVSACKALGCIHTDTA